MGRLRDQVRDLVSAGSVRVSLHGYRQPAEDGLSVREVVDGLPGSVVVEEYPEYHKGPCILLPQRDADDRPVHAVWGIPRGAFAPAVLVTAYRPDPRRWSDDYLRRRE